MMKVEKPQQLQRQKIKEPIAQRQKIHRHYILSSNRTKNWVCSEQEDTGLWGFSGAKKTLRPRRSLAKIFYDFEARMIHTLSHTFHTLSHIFTHFPHTSASIKIEQHI